MVKKIGPALAILRAWPAYASTMSSLDEIDPRALVDPQVLENGVLGGKRQKVDLQTRFQAM